jgi:hypothetical protein
LPTTLGKDRNPPIAVDAASLKTPPILARKPASRTVENRGSPFSKFVISENLTQLQKAETLQGRDVCGNKVGHASDSDYCHGLTTGARARSKSVVSRDKIVRP